MFSMLRNQMNRRTITSRINFKNISRKCFCCYFPSWSVVDMNCILLCILPIFLRVLSKAADVIDAKTHFDTTCLRLDSRAYVIIPYLIMLRSSRSCSAFIWFLYSSAIWNRKICSWYGGTARIRFEPAWPCRYCWVYWIDHHTVSCKIS